MFGGLERPPLWATIVMVVGLVALVVLTPIAINRGEVSAESPVVPSRPDAGEPSTSTPAPTSATPTPDAPESLAVLGDEYSTGTGADTPDQGFAELLAEGLGLTLAVSAGEGAGYTTGSPGGFLDLVPQAVAAQPDVVLVQGGINDRRADRADIEQSAGATFDAIWESAPDAHIIALGAPFVPDLNAAAIQTTKDAVRAAAVARGIPFIDPADWLAVDDATLWADGVHPTSAGHRVLADRLAQEFPSALAVAAGANE
ncbi:SGNH/GDSL hydrolase family protein [Modestobacter sp. URMC 112]